MATPSSIYTPRLNNRLARHNISMFSDAYLAQRIAETRENIAYFVAMDRDDADKRAAYERKHLHLLVEAKLWRDHEAARRSARTLARINAWLDEAEAA